MLKRVYHPVSEWEEMNFNMWGVTDNKSALLTKAITFTGDHDLYGSFMQRVIKEWPISCENSLTDNNLNKRAWIGHAAVALALQIPEDVTREAWGKLTDEQQLLANREATRAIQQWEESYRENKGLHSGVERQMLL
jgi:hypothetical protein